MEHTERKFDRTRLSRRTFIRTSGSALAAGAAAGAAWLGGVPPARAQTRRLAFLLQSSFSPKFDAEVKALCADYEQATGTAVAPEFINLNDLTPRIIAALESGQGPDLFILFWNQAHLYAGKLADVSDIAAKSGGSQFYPGIREVVQVGGVYRAHPWYTVASCMVYNKPLCDKLGILKYPDTYDELMVAGKKMKQAGTPVGWCLGHTIGDGAFGNYPIFWSFGAAEVDEKGRVNLNSKEGRVAVEWMRQFWHDACDETGMGWNDASNNQAFLAQQCAAVFNAPSIILKARVDKMPLANDIRHTIAPAGPFGRYHVNTTLSIAIPGYSKNLAAAKEFLGWLMAKPQYARAIGASAGQGQGNSPEWEKHPIWSEDPIMAPFAQVPRYGRNPGFKGPFNRAAAEVQAKYIIADTFARGIREGADPALKWAEQEMTQIYGRA